MLLGKVIGTVVATQVYEGLSGVPMLLVQPLAKDGAEKGARVVCADGTRMAGPGELVYYEGGREAAMTLNPWFVPVDHAIVGIVDGVQAPELERRPDMIIGRVLGNITSTINHPFYDGKKLLLVEKIEPDGKTAAGYLVAVDRAGAGPGETVLVLDEGNGARQVLESADGPVRSVIVGIVDEINEAKTP